MENDQLAVLTALAKEESCTKSRLFVVYISNLRKLCTIRSGLEHREAAKKIEDEFDLKAHDRALAEYRKIPKTFTHAEVCRMLESEE